MQVMVLQQRCILVVLYRLIVLIGDRLCRVLLHCDLVSYLDVFLCGLEQLILPVT